MVGNITNSKLLGGWTLKMELAGKLPQEVTTAFGNLFDKFGASYTPIYYVGTSVGNGINHKLIAQRDKLISGGKHEIDYCAVTINIPIGSVGGKGAKLVSVEDATDFVLRDEIEKGFKKAMAKFKGVTHKPLLELGTQVVKGTNYFFICESKLDSDDEPYPSMVVINNFKDDWNIVAVYALKKLG